MCAENAFSTFRSIYSGPKSGALGAVGGVNWFLLLGHGGNPREACEKDACGLISKAGWFTGEA